MKVPKCTQMQSAGQICYMLNHHLKCENKLRDNKNEDFPGKENRGWVVIKEEIIFLSDEVQSGDQFSGEAVASEFESFHTRAWKCTTEITLVWERNEKRGSTDLIQPSLHSAGIFSTDQSGIWIRPFFTYHTDVCLKRLRKRHELEPKYDSKNGFFGLLQGKRQVAEYYEAGSWQIRGTVLQLRAESISKMPLRN